MIRPGTVIWAKTFAGNIESYLYEYSMTIDGAAIFIYAGI